MQKMEKEVLQKVSASFKKEDCRKFYRISYKDRMTFMHFIFLHIGDVDGSIEVPTIKSKLLKTIYNKV